MNQFIHHSTLARARKTDSVSHVTGCSLCPVENPHFGCNFSSQQYLICAIISRLEVIIGGLLGVVMTLVILFLLIHLMRRVMRPKASLETVPSLSLNRSSTNNQNLGTKEPNIKAFQTYLYPDMTAHNTLGIPKSVNVPNSGNIYIDIHSSFRNPKPIVSII